MDTGQGDQQQPRNFSMLLSEFMFSGRGAKQKLNMRFEGELVCNKPAPKVLVSSPNAKGIVFRLPKLKTEMYGTI